MSHYHLKRVFGISIEDFEVILDCQNNQCLICLNPFSKEKGRRPSVDHCHATGVIRGVLCAFCNGMLGKAKDDPAFFKRAIEYLKRGG